MITALHSNSYMRSRVTHNLSICPTAATAHTSVWHVCSHVLSSVCYRLLPLVPVSAPPPPSRPHTAVPGDTVPSLSACASHAFAAVGAQIAVNVNQFNDFADLGFDVGIAYDIAGEDFYIGGKQQV